MTPPDPRLPYDDADPEPRREDPHEAYEELAAGYALSALEPGEEQQFLRHLLTCARCERDVLEHRETLAHLAYAVEPAVPPPGLLDGIRQGVLAHDDLDAYGTAPAQPSVADELGAARDRRRLRRTALAGSVAAGALLVVALGGWNLSLQRDRDAAEQRAAALDRSRATLAATVATLQDAPGRTVPLRTTRGEVLLVAVVQGRTVDLVVDDLPANDRATSTYVLWGQSTGGLQALAAFDVAPAEVDVVRDLQLPASVEALPTVFLVSRESGRAAPQAPAEGPLASGEPA